MKREILEVVFGADVVRLYGVKNMRGESRAVPPQAWDWPLKRGTHRVSGAGPAPRVGIAGPKKALP